jgi:hypothetical protein
LEAYKKTHKPTIRLDDTAFNKTKVRVLLVLREVNKQNNRYLGLRELASLGAASYAYLKVRMRQFERWRYIKSMPVENTGKGQSFYRGYRIVPKGLLFLANCERYHPDKVAELIANLDITVD